MTIIKKNLVDAFEDGDVSSIIHGVNCRGVMGSGIAKEIRSRYPQVFTDYISFCRNTDAPLLGRVCVSGDGPWIFNCFTQEFYGKDGKKYVDDDAIVSSLTWVRNFLQEKGCKSLGIPYLFCCGLGGGDWTFVSAAIERIFTDIEVTIYQL